MTIPLFEEAEKESTFMAFVQYEGNDYSMRRCFASLYDAKIWILEKIYTNKEQNTKLLFPFGFDYCIITNDFKVINPEEINLPERNDV